MSELRAVALLTGSLVRRFLREGLILRSLAFPLGLTAGTLVVTLLVVALVRPQRVVAVPPQISPTLVESIEAHGFDTRVEPDLKEAVLDGRVWSATDGTTVWHTYPDSQTALLEAVVREEIGAAWRPELRLVLPQVGQAGPIGELIVHILGALFALYGVVFGVGTVARDRDDGSLEAELTLPIPRWIPGLARWIAGSLLLGLFYALAALVFTALFGIAEPGALIRNGAAGGATAVAIGLVTVGRAGIARGGFTSALSTGLLLGTLVMGAGLALPGPSAWVPLASMMGDGGGWAPLGLSLLAGGGASLVFGWRSA